jgi:hypothetical protein
MYACPHLSVTLHKETDYNALYCQHFINNSTVSNVVLLLNVSSEICQLLNHVESSVESTLAARETYALDLCAQSLIRCITSACPAHKAT